MEPVRVYVCIMYISATLQGVAIKVFPPTSQFHRNWGLNAKQLPLKHKKTHTPTHTVRGSTTVRALDISTHFVMILKLYQSVVLRRL